MNIKQKKPKMSSDTDKDDLINLFEQRKKNINSKPSDKEKSKSRNVSNDRNLQSEKSKSKITNNNTLNKSTKITNIAFDNYSTHSKNTINSIHINLNDNKSLKNRNTSKDLKISISKIQTNVNNNQTNQKNLNIKSNLPNINKPKKNEIKENFFAPKSSRNNCIKQNDIFNNINYTVDNLNDLSNNYNTVVTYENCYYKKPFNKVINNENKTRSKSPTIIKSINSLKGKFSPPTNKANIIETNKESSAISKAKKLIETNKSVNTVNKIDQQSFFSNSSADTKFSSKTFANNMSINTSQKKKLKTIQISSENMSNALNNSNNNEQANLNNSKFSNIIESIITQQPQKNIITQSVTSPKTISNNNIQNKIFVAPKRVEPETSFFYDKIQGSNNNNQLSPFNESLVSSIKDDNKDDLKEDSLFYYGTQSKNFMGIYSPVAADAPLNSYVK